MGGLICGRLNTIENVAHLRHLSTAFIAAASHHKVPILVIDGLRARRNWRAGLTGEEALLSQHRDLVREGEYVQLSKR